MIVSKQKWCFVSQTDPDGRSCLHLACCSGNVSAVECLLSHGANANAFDKHKLATPLFCCIVSVTPHHVSCVDALINAGADINAGKGLKILIYFSYWRKSMLYEFVFLGLHDLGVSALHCAVRWDIILFLTLNWHIKHSFWAYIFFQSKCCCKCQKVSNNIALKEKAIFEHAFWNLDFLNEEPYQTVSNCSVRHLCTLQHVGDMMIAWGYWLNMGLVWRSSWDRWKWLHCIWLLR